MFEDNFFPIPMRFLLNPFAICFASGTIKPHLSTYSTLFLVSLGPNRFLILSNKRLETP